MLCDGGMLAISCLLLLALRGMEGLPLAPAQLALLAVLGGFFHLLTLRRIGGYRVERYGLRGRQLLDLLLGVSVGWIIVSLVSVVFLEPARGGEWLPTWSGLALLCLAFGRFAPLAALLRQVQRKALLRRRVAIVGSEAKSSALVAAMSRAEQREDYELLGVFVEEETVDLPPSIGGVPVRGRLGELLAFTREEQVDLIVIAVPWEATARINHLFERVQRIPADIVVPLEESVFSPRFARVGSVAGAPVLQVMYHPLKGSQGLIKLAEDYIIGSLALLISAPIILLAAIAIKLDSPGPVFFLQSRVGFNNKPFKIYKLRTMTVDPTDDGSRGTVRGDPRITRVGGILRRLSIDELPQLINVMKGEMSVVGPRPHVANMLVSGEQYYDAVREYAARYRIKPGITGWAQINGMRGGIDTKEKAKRNVALDLHYIENWSLWFDFKIMVLTVTTGLFGRNVF